MREIKKKYLLISFVLIVILFSSLNTAYASNSKVIAIKDLPIGSVVYDPSWEWEHKIADRYTGNGSIKPIDWVIVAKNHYNNPNESITILTNELIAKYMFDNSIDRGHIFGSNYWGDNYINSSLRKWLNTTFYNSFSNKLRDSIVKTHLPNKNHLGVSFTTIDNVFIPSETELGSNNKSMYTVGTDWGFFKNDESRVSNIGEYSWPYWTRSPQPLNTFLVRYVHNTGSFYYSSAFIDNYGIRPAVNLQPNTLVCKNYTDYQKENCQLVLKSTLEDEDNSENEIDISIIGNVTSWTNKDILLQIKAVDKNGEIKRIQLPDKSWVDTSNTSFLITSNGHYVFKAQNHKGEIAEKTIFISNIDKISPTKPSLSISNNNKLILSLSIDRQSGVDKHIFRLNNGDWNTWQNDFILTSLEDGEYIFEVKGIDIAGNESYSYTYNLNIGKRFLLEAIEAVEVAETEGNKESIKEAYELVDKLPNSRDKSSLISRLRTVEKRLLKDLATTILEKDAVNLVMLSEILKREPYIQNAKNKIGSLDDGLLKESLNDRILKLEESLSSTESKDLNIKTAERFVILAESLKREPHIERAKDAVSKLEDSSIKTDLLKRLFLLEYKDEFLNNEI